MKRIIFIFLSILIFVACKGKINKEYSNKNNVFRPVLEREILNMIDANKNEIKFKVCNIIISRDMNRDRVCIVAISMRTHIVCNMIKFIPPGLEQNAQDDSEFVGYTFLKNRLIACCLLSNSCSNILINRNELYPIQDSIPGYPDVLIPSSEFAPTRIYEIVNEDSLRLIDSSFASD